MAKTFRDLKVWQKAHKLKAYGLRLTAGFTYVEILVTLSLIAILFIPMMQLFSNALEATETSRDLITAVNLARWEMERVKNIGGSTERLRMLGNTEWPPLDGPPLELNGTHWRIARLVKIDSDPLEVTVEVHQEGNPKALATVVTLLTDTFWGQGKPAGK